MADPLKDKIVKALTEATGSNATVNIDAVAGGRYGGLVLWSGFAGTSPSERQDRIWATLDAALTPAERTKISFIVTDTAEEHDSISKARDEVA